MRKQSLILGLVVLSLVALAGCAKPPEELMKQTQAALDDAKAAQADIYAPDSINKAQETMNQANAEIETQKGKFALFRSYKKAEELLNQAKAQGETAKQDAIAGKEKAKNEAQAAIDAAKTALEAAKTAVSKAPMGKDTKAEVEAMKAELDALTGTLTEAETDFTGEKYFDAKGKAEQVSSKSAGIDQQVQAAIEKRKGKKR